MACALLVLFLLGLALQPAPAQTLAPGKPAGIQAAQHISQRGRFIVGSPLAVGLAFGVPASSPSSTSTATATTTS